LSALTVYRPVWLRVGMVLLGTPSARAIALVVAWSSGFIGAELGAGRAGPDTLLTWRCLAIAAVLLPWTARAARELTAADWRRQAVIALFSQCLYLGGVFWAAAHGVPAGTSALIASLQPAVVLAVTVVAVRGRWRAGHALGLALGTAGVALTSVGDLSAGLTPAALLLPLGAMLALSMGTLLQQRWSRERQVPLAETLGVQSLVSAAVITTGTTLLGDPAPPTAAGFWLAVAWSALAGLGSYACYYLITQRDGAARASTLLYLTPAATALWAAPMFGQPIRPLTLLGLAISGAAVALLRDGGRRSAVTVSAVCDHSARCSRSHLPNVHIRQTPPPQPNDRQAARSSPQSSASRRTCGA
jgi:drug/metabolite transporter (DMT)-like permease